MKNKVKRFLLSSIVLLFSFTNVFPVHADGSVGISVSFVKLDEDNTTTSPEENPESGEIEEIEDTSSHEHYYKETSNIAPTCVSPGIVTLTCECGNIIIHNTDALGHILGTSVKKNEIAATIESNGSYDIVGYCGRCGEELSCEHFITDKLQKNEEHNHSYVLSSTVQPTCHSKGYYLYKCECGDFYYNYIDEIPHSYEDIEEIIKTVSATENEEGYILYGHHCKYCDDIVDTRVDVIPVIEPVIEEPVEEEVIQPEKELIEEDPSDLPERKPLLHIPRVIQENPEVIISVVCLGIVATATGGVNYGYLLLLAIFNKKKRVKLPGILSIQKIPFVKVIKGSTDSRTFKELVMNKKLPEIAEAFQEELTYTLLPPKSKALITFMDENGEICDTSSFEPTPDNIIKELSYFEGQNVTLSIIQPKLKMEFSYSLSL